MVNNGNKYGIKHHRRQQGVADPLQPTESCAMRNDVFAPGCRVLANGQRHAL